MCWSKRLDPIAACRLRRSLHQSGRSAKIVHRLAVFDKTGDVQHIISQSDVIR
jgi:CBS-domain-containing membrane protein